MSVRRIVGGVAAILLAHASLAPAAVAQLPTGGSVASGTVIIGTSGLVLTITQSSQLAIVNWNTFSIGQPNTVNFNQPNSSSAILNRVTGSTPSTIAGQLNANGVVFLINPNGIAITSTGTVNVGGGFVASTLNMTDAEFLAGRSRFTGSGASASVSNAGLITIGRGGYAALIGGTVNNSGRIVVPLGKVALGSGERVTLDFSGDQFLQVAVPTMTPSEEALVRQSGTISAPGGQIIISAATARDAARNAINMTGVLEANTIGGQTGSIELGGGPGGNVAVAGEINATGTGANDGGRVAISGSTLFVTGKIDTSGRTGGQVAIAANRQATVSGTVRATGAAGPGGTIAATAPSLALKGATLDASGATGGGGIALGGEFQSGGILVRADVVSIDSATTIAADALQVGHGGNIVVWSSLSTDFAGLITARGGASGGDGGKVEVSSRTEMSYTGLAVLTAASGVTGSLLLEADDLYIAGISAAPAPEGWSTIGVATLAAQLAQANVVLAANESGDGTGTIVLAAGTDLAWTSTSRLTLAADNSIVLAGNVTAPNGALILLAAGAITDTTATTVSAGAIDLAAASIRLAGAWQANGGLLGIAGRDSVLVSSTARIASDSAGGGNVTILASGGPVQIAGQVTALGAAGSGGTVSITAPSVILAASGRVDASGSAAGGTVQIGGGWQGGGPLVHALSVVVESGAQIRADATLQGSGGTIAVWSDGETVVRGMLTAAGAGLGGDGGRIETSGHLLDVAGIAIDASAPSGTGGIWLLDPFNLTVTAGGTTAVQSPVRTWTSGSGTSNVSNATINAALNAGTSVVLQTGGTSAQLGDITVSAAISKTAGGAASLTLLAHGSIIINAGITSTVGALAVTLNSNRGGAGGYVAVNAPITTLGGALIIGGGANPLTGAAIGTAAQISGVYINASSALTTAGGAITIRGTGLGSTTSITSMGVFSDSPINAAGGNISITGVGGGTGASLANFGVHATLGGSIATSGTGTITISGIGGDPGGTGRSNLGVTIYSAVTTVGGTISITGTGGNSSGVTNIGIELVRAVINSGNGAIILNGTSGGSGTAEFGIYSSATITAGTGNISITGLASTTATGSTNHGVFLDAGSISTTGAGTITIAGTARGTAAGADTYGVLLSGGATVTAAGGLVRVTGTNLSTGTGGFNDGVYVTGVGSTIKSTGTGGVTVLGFGGGTGAGGGNYGVYWDVANGIASTGGGAIGITGTGGGTGGSGASNHGVYVGGTLAGSGGAISITGTGGNSSGATNFGIYQVSAISNTGTGRITLGGTSGGTGTTAFGIQSYATSITAATGNIVLTGVASAAATSGTNYGIDILGSTVSTGGAGTITLDGTGRGSGTGGTAYGVVVEGGGIVTAANGLVSVTGRSTSTGTGDGNIGVVVTGAGSTIRSTGTGGVTVIGFGGGAGASSNSYGVLSNVANGIQSTGTGAITITGTGGDAGGTGANNHGVYATAALTGGGGAITITGTASNSSGGGNRGISLASVTDGAGIVTLSSTGVVTASGALTAGGLRLLGAGGSYTLTNAGNAVTTLAASTGSVNYAQTGNLSIGTVGATTGIAATGTVLVNVAGNLGLAAGTTVRAVGTGNALQLVDSGTFTNLAGAGALGVTGGGRWLVWSTSPAADNRGSLAYGFKQYGATFGTTTPADSTNNGFLYSTAAGPLTVGLTGTVAKGYDATTAATLAAGNYTLGGALDGDTVIFTRPTAGTYDTVNTGTGKTVTVTGLSITSASNGGAAVYGYTLTSTAAAGPVGTITAATLTYTATGATRTYGAANPALGGTTTGFVGGDTLANATTGTASFATLANAASNVGTYLISGSGLTANSGNYVFVQAAANTNALAVTPATLTYTANAATRGYGAANPALGGTVTGFVNAQTLATATTGTQTFTTLATTASNVGTYLVTGSGLAANNGNYVFVQAAANNTALAVTPATLTYTANAATRGYGAANPALGGTTTGFMGSDTLANATTGAASFTTLATAASNVGAYAITGSGLTANSGNYVFVQAAANSTALTVTPATLTYTANTSTRTYGAANPALGGTTTGFMGTDTLANATTGTASFTTLAGAASNVGSYLVTGGGLAANSGNYVFVQAAANAGALSVTPATLTYVADAATRTYGAANPALGGTVTGFVNSQTLATATTGGASFTTLATTASNVGTYLITGSGLTANSGNYVFVQAAANSNALTVTPATLTYTADAATRTYGAANPALSGTTTGFMGSDTLANATTGTAAFTTLAGAASNVGSYLVAGGGLAANNGNYIFVQAAANSTALTVTAATLTYTADAATRGYGAANPALGGTTTGFMGSDTLANATTGTASFTTLAGAASNVGSYLVTGGGLAANSGNYVFVQAAANSNALSVTPATLTYVADAATRGYGAANPALGGTVTGFVNAQTLATATTGTQTFTTLATMASNVGSYLVTGGGLTANSGNYVFVQAAANSTALSVTAATLTYTANAATRTYGAANPALTGTTTGFMGSDTLASATTGTASFTTLAGAASNVGTYLVTGGGLAANNGNYVFVQAAANNNALSVTPATLTYVADAATRTYGAANPALGGTVTGFVNSQTLASATTGAASFTTLATTTSNVGTYLITGSGLAANSGNYVFVQAAANSTALTVTAATLTYTADAATRTYGAANPALGGTTTGFMGTDTLANATTGTAAFTTLAGAASNVGTYLISGGGLVANNGNYVFAQAAANATALAITPATLTYTADAATRTYGAANPALSGTTSGYMGADTQLNATGGTLLFTTLAGAASNVGAYAITGAGLTANNGNYIFVQAAGNSTALTVTAATLTYTADAATRTYGATNPALGGTTTGFMGSDTLANATTGTASFTTLATAASNTGSYLISGAGLTANNGNYVFVQAAANATALTITPATVTYTADAATRTYGAANPALSGTATGFMGSDTLGSATTGTMVFTTLATAASNVGTYLIGGSGLSANNGNYVFVQAAANGTALAITPATLTYTADAATRVYGAANPSLGGTASGFVGGDTLANATTGTSVFTTLATTASNVGSYAIAGSGLTANNGNYVFVQAATNSNALTITPATLTYTADAATRTYGAANPAFTGTVVGFAGSDTLANATGGTLAFTTLATTASNVGSYLITGSGLTASNGNYVFVQAAANATALTITPASLTLVYTADGATRTYGAANPALSGTVTGFLGADTQANATTGTLVFTTLADAASNVGTYLITGSGLVANNGNYLFTQAAANNNALVITPATLTYTADAATRTYGAANPALSGTVTGFVNAQTLASATTGSAAFTTLATTASNVGSYDITGSGLVANSGNYVFAQAAANSTALSITPATLTYTADAATRTYGAANPALGGTTTGYMGADTQLNATTGIQAFTTLATAASNVGSYLVAGSGLTANNGNYIFVQAAANSTALTITPATVTYTADAATRTYGAANPALGGTTTGFMGSDTLASATTGTVSFTTLATAGSNVGSYLIAGSGLVANNGNYLFVQAAANATALTITAATLIYTADAATRTYGAANPALGGTATGFMGADTLANATTGTASFTTLATAASNVGSYLIGGSGLVANNGNYVFVQAVTNSNALTITPATLTYTADAATRTYGAANPAFSGTTTGFMGSDTLANATTGTQAFTTLATAASNVGAYLITGSGLTANNGNYVFVQAAANSGALTITAATLTYTADLATRTYGAANPALTGTTTGFMGSDTLANATSGTMVFTTLATTVSNVGSYLIAGSGLTANNGNYVFVQATANNTALTVNPATLTVSGSKTYDATAAYGGNQLAVAGAMNGETVTVMAGVGTSASGNAGIYAGSVLSGLVLSVSGGNALASNYVLPSTGTLTISAATLTYTADAVSRIYGTTNPVLSGTVTGFVGGESQASATTGIMTFTSLASPTSSGGSYAVTGAGLVANNGNYRFVQAAANSNALSVTPAPPPVAPPLTISLPSTAFPPPTFSDLPLSTMGSIEIAEQYLNPASDLPLLLTGTETYLAQNIGSTAVEIAADPRFDGIVACQDPTLFPDCRITHQQ